MRYCVLVAAMLMSAAPGGISQAADNQLTPQERAAGWLLLFDGKTFTNWVDPTRQSPPGESFVIEDGCLKATNHPKLQEDLFTTATFRDFELVFDWKISPRGNSGVKYRIQDHQFLLDEPRGGRFEDRANQSMRNRRTDRPAKGQDYVIGFEYQIVDNAGNPDALRNGAVHATGALYDAFPPSQDVTRPVGEFNHSRLVVKGDHVEHWLNGVKVVDASLKAPEIERAAAKRWGAGNPIYNLLVNQPRLDCPISLQNHDDPAWFKNIKIRRLE
jgi:Domain of Unknown Function (DUF1080)